MMSFYRANQSGLVTMLENIAQENTGGLAKRLRLIFMRSFGRIGSRR